jgi:hypothetical protein
VEVSTQALGDAIGEPRMSTNALLEHRIGRTAFLLLRVAFWAAASVLAFALCRRGLTLSDEGDLLMSALSIVEGKVPYRDLDLFVTPGAWYLNAAVFAIAGPSVIATRIAAAGCLLATMAATRRIVRTSAGPLWGDFSAGVIAIFAVWAWPTWTWSFYSPWATLFSMLALVCTLEWMRTRRPAWLVACGLALGAAIVFKQNYGVFAAVGCGLAVLLDEFAVRAVPGTSAREVLGRTLRAGLLVALGGALVLIPGVLWLASQGALPAAFDLLFLRPFQGFIDSHSIRYLRIGDLWRQAQIWIVGGLVYMAVPVKELSVPMRWPSPALSLVVLLHVALYWIPVFAFAGFGLRGLLRLRRNPSLEERSLLAMVVFAAVYFLGVFPRADFNHLINVYQPILAMLVAGAAMCFGQGRWRRSAIIKASTGAVAIGLLCYAGVAAVWMNDLRKKVWIPLDAPRARLVLLEPLEAQILNDEIASLRELTAYGEPVFALPNLSLIPFLAERPMPTRYRNFYAVHIGHDMGREAAHDIERSNARIVLASYDNFFSDPIGMTTYGHELVEYLRLRFRPVFSLGNTAHMLLVRRKVPLAAAPSQDLWTLCDIRPIGFPATFVREHLLFRSLYHSFRGASAEYNQGLTTCQFKVPESARVKLRLELRQPTPASRPASVRAEVWLFANRGRPRRLLEREWSLAGEITSVREIGEEFEMDLTKWHGEVVSLMLRTLVEGAIPESPFDPFGLTVMWNDARLESPEYADEEGVQQHE